MISSLVAVVPFELFQMQAPERGGGFLHEQAGRDFFSAPVATVSLGGCGAMSNMCGWILQEF